jgi:hypothetical protein
MIGQENFRMELLLTAGESFYKTKLKDKGKKIEIESDRLIINRIS